MDFGNHHELGQLFTNWFSDTNRMRNNQIVLKQRRFLVRDLYITQRSKAGIDSVDRLV